MLEGFPHQWMSTYCDKFWGLGGEGVCEGVWHCFNCFPELHFPGFESMWKNLAFNVKYKPATGWSVFASGVHLGRSRVLSGPPDRR